MKRYVLIAAALGVATLYLGGCAPEEHQTVNKAPASASTADTTGQKNQGNGAVFPATDPPPPDGVKGKGVEFGSKAGGG